ncbi:hypothetical protein BpHYR1_025901 [Brachionus plicatilis]|uniref:Transmembrane protein n=1 Tax=Brachionus plicatilis TaxID=10195 RepID=A0A3M7T108_BRAPC|nr:hypothetical protein BpHYR1_025901 [Brachionus plicatilis]
MVIWAMKKVTAVQTFIYCNENIEWSANIQSCLLNWPFQNKYIMDTIYKTKAFLFFSIIQQSTVVNNQIFKRFVVFKNKDIVELSSLFFFLKILLVDIVFFMNLLEKIIIKFSLIDSNDKNSKTLDKCILIKIKKNTKDTKFKK